MKTLTDTELVTAIRAGSAEAADDRFPRQWPRAWKAASAVLGDCTAWRRGCGR